MYVVRARNKSSNGKHWLLTGFDDDRPIGGYELDGAITFESADAARAALGKSPWLADCDVIEIGTRSSEA